MQLDKIYDRLQKDMDALNNLIEELATSDFTDADEVMQRLYNKLLLTAKFVANNKSKAGLDENTESQPSRRRKRVIDSQDEQTEKDAHADKFGEHVALENGKSVDFEKQQAFAERTRERIGQTCASCLNYKFAFNHCEIKKVFTHPNTEACSEFVKK